MRRRPASTKAVDLGDTAPGFLRRGNFKSKLGRQHYQVGSDQFRQWVVTSGIATSAEVGNFSHDLLDKHLEAYVEKLCLYVDSVFNARTAVYGEAWRRGWNIKHVRTLELSRGALAGWSNLRPDQ